MRQEYLVSKTSVKLKLQLRSQQQRYDVCISIHRTLLSYSLCYSSMSLFHTKHETKLKHQQNVYETWHYITHGILVMRIT